MNQDGVEHIGFTKHGPYGKWGTRSAYIKSLAEDYGLTNEQVWALAFALGPEEDFDALVSFVNEVSDPGA